MPTLAREEEVVTKFHPSQGERQEKKAMNWKNKNLWKE